MCLIKQRLPHFICRVSMPIHNTSITQDHSCLISLKCSLQENVLQAHLRLHDLDLESDLVHQGHFMRLDETATFHHHCGRFRDQKHFEAFRCQVISYGRQSCSFASAWPSSQADSEDRILRGR